VPAPLTVLFAPDSFKGSLTSVEVARALAAGWARARPDDELLLSPLADGGEGTLVAIEASGGWERVQAKARDPLGVDVPVSWLRSADGRRAVVELAEASGLSRVAPDAREPLSSTTFGTGQVLEAVLDAGIRDITLGIGGSATTDGGSGILQALGVEFRWTSDYVPSLAPDLLLDLDSIDFAGVDSRLAEVHLRIACDVTNPLLGAHGAAATYGPQKGADPDQVMLLDDALARYADVLESATGQRQRDTPGAGAAGGTAFGLLCLRGRFGSIELVPGVELVMGETDLDGKLRRSDIVLTGEGRVDDQTAYGKTALGVARRAAGAGVRCVVVGGGVTPGGIEALAPFNAVVVPVTEGPQTVGEAMAAGAAPIERCSERIARLVGLTKSID
jgi:glycerate 2-kinase